MIGRRPTKIIIYRGRPHLKVELLRRHRLDKGTFDSRLRRGWSIEAALETPPRRYPARRTVDPALRYPLTQQALLLLREARAVVDNTATPRREALVRQIDELLRTAASPAAPAP